MIKSHIKLFSCCFLTNGFTRTIILDNQRSKLYFIPNSLFQLIDKNNILISPKNLSIEEQIVWKEYETFLIVNELAFYCEANLLKSFPKISTDWDEPYIISNAIIEVDFNIFSFDNFKKLLIDITDNLLCYRMEINFSNVLNEENLNKFLSFMNTLDLFFYNISINGKGKSVEEIEYLVKYLKSYYKIYKIIIFNSSFNNVYLSDKSGWGNIFVITGSYNPKHCGIVSTDYFSFALPHYTESQHHNTCLNRKISIDANGEIKNCPSMAKSYGNIKDTKLIDVVNNPEFQKVWHIKKDEITKCKDCEFRHICTDCRAYIDNPDDIYSAPLKCGYDPYTGVWEEWSTNPLKEKAIQFYGMESLVKNGE